MQKNSEFFRKIARGCAVALLISALSTGCASETADPIGSDAPLSGATTVGTTIPRPTERPVSTLTPDPPAPPDLPVGDYQWNPYVFDRLAGEYREDAIRLADAILNYETEVNVSAEHAEVLCENFAFEFPPSALAELKAKGNCVEITYLYPRNEHEKKIDLFRKNVNLALSAVSSEDSELTRAIKLYDWVVKNVTYFYTDYTDKEITCFSALTAGVTICYGFADAFGYLLRQTEMEAHLWRGGTQTINGFSEHGWCYAKIDGTYYHFDPTWEYSAAKNSGKNQYIYFGLSDARRFTSLSRKCVSGFGAIEETCNPYGAMNNLEIEIES